LLDKNIYILSILNAVLINGQELLVFYELWRLLKMLAAIVINKINMLIVSVSIFAKNHGMIRD
jgi:hypothetical protein